MDKILGFTIRSKGMKFYGVKRVGSKVIWIALGDNPEGAEAKIIAYCSAKGIDLNAKKMQEKVTDSLTENVRKLTENVRMLESKLIILDSENKEVRARLEAENNILKNRIANLELKPVTVQDFTVASNVANIEKQPKHVAGRGKKVSIESKIDKAKAMQAEGKAWNVIRRRLNLDRNKEEMAKIKEILGM